MSTGEGYDEVTERRKLAVHRATEALSAAFGDGEYTGEVAFHFVRGEVRKIEERKVYRAPDAGDAPRATGTGDGR